MSNPLYGEIKFTIQQIYVASLDETDDTYGTPALIGYVQDGDVSPEHDTDTIKAGGANREMLSVQIGSTVTINEAWLSDAAHSIVTGETSSESGASGSRQRKRINEGAGGGLPYIGMIIVGSATNGAGGVMGFAKMMANSKPQFALEQNTFRTGEIEFGVLTAKPTNNKIVKQVDYEAFGDIPDFTDQAEFQSFMDEMFT